ncbi:hypothetical protein AMTRI_Chr02g220630 [Amborella trichopoda]
MTSSFCLSKISFMISSCFFKSCPSLKNTQITTSIALIRFFSLSKISKISDPKICLILVKVFFSPSMLSNGDQWFPYPSPDHSVLVHENIIGIIVKLPFYFMLLGLLLLGYYGGKL